VTRRNTASARPLRAPYGLKCLDDVRSIVSLQACLQYHELRPCIRLHVCFLAASASNRPLITWQIIIPSPCCDRHSLLVRPMSSAHGQSRLDIRQIFTLHSVRRLLLHPICNDLPRRSTVCICLHAPRLTLSAVGSGTASTLCLFLNRKRNNLSGNDRQDTSNSELTSRISDQILTFCETEICAQ
jgi:hypothetical protein